MHLWRRTVHSAAPEAVSGAAESPDQRQEPPHWQAPPDWQPQLHPEPQLHPAPRSGSGRRPSAMSGVPAGEEPRADE